MNPKPLVWTDRAAADLEEIDAYIAANDPVAAERWIALDFEALALEDLSGHEISWRYDGQRIQVSWSEGAERDATRMLAIRYRVQHPVSGLFFSGTPARHPLVQHLSKSANTESCLTRQRQTVTLGFV